MEHSLAFNGKQYRIDTVTLGEQAVTFRAFENIVYVKHPVDPDYQKLSVFVPEIYYEGKSTGNYSLRTAPIFMPNTVGGYMPGKPDAGYPGVNPYTKKANAAFAALQKGYVVVIPGIRGRGLKDEAGKNIGVAPACIVDYKAAVRYLRFNKESVPGDVEKIVSNGTSAGGALSALLGTTGNHPDYKPYLEKIGAADERDDIFAASCYCPITDLEHADMAYEWEFNGLNEYHGIKFEMIDGKPKLTPTSGEMTALQKELSEKEKALFPEYLNSLNLATEDGTKLRLDAAGNGSFKDYVAKFLVESAQRALDLGQEVAGNSWLTVEGKRVMAVDFSKYAAFATRMKKTPAFDSIELNTPENELFGSSDLRYRHFTSFSAEHSLQGGKLAEAEQIKMMNPMNYIGDKDCTTARNFRIRHGAVDRDTSLAIPVILKTKLQMEKVAVDFHLPWGTPHSGDYDLDELFAWMEKIC